MIVLLTGVVPCRRAFFDKRLAQEVEGDSLGEVRALAVLVPGVWSRQLA